MGDPGSRPELRWLPIDRLWVDLTYQRTLESRRSQKLIARIADNFSWSKFGAVLAAPSATGWKLLDGQHRVAGARLRDDIPEVPALVVDISSVAEHAAAFVSANRDRVAVNAYALFRARLAALEPEALAMKAIADYAGVTIAPYPPQRDRIKPGWTVAIVSFSILPKRHGPEIARLAFKAVADAYREQPGGLTKVFFDAAAAVIAERPPYLETAQKITAALCAISSARLDDAVARRRLKFGGSFCAAATVEFRSLIGAAPGVIKSPPAQRHRYQPLPKPCAHERAQPVSEDEISRFVAEHPGRGITHLPPAFAAASEHAAIEGGEARRRIAAIPVEEKLSFKERKRISFQNAQRPQR